MIGGVMTLFTLFVFIAFLAIVFIMVPRVLKVFSGHRLFRIVGATLFVAAGLMMLVPAAAVRWAVHSSPSRLVRSTPR
jgi:Na+/melibiose symporter-like transporter